MVKYNYRDMNKTKIKYLKERASKYKIEPNFLIQKYSNTKECECCSLPFKDSKSKHVDHCHSSDQFRGILCRSCNVMLGYAKDNPQRLLNGIKYLETHYSHWDSVLKNEQNENIYE